MEKFASADRIITEAIRHYVTVIRLPELARAMRRRAADLAAASRALRALTQAVEELNDSETDPWSLQRRFPELLTAHQMTWHKAFQCDLAGQFAEATRSLFSYIWRAFCLPVLLDRSDKSAGVVRCSDFNWIRIFGRPREKAQTWTLLVSDGYFTGIQRIGSKEHPQDTCPLWLAIGTSSGFLRLMRKKEGHEVLGGRDLYDYSAISEQDLSVKIEAMRDVAASVDYMRKLILFSAGAYEEKDLLSLGYVYKLLDENKISTGAFHRALTQEHKVQLHTLEVARLRARQVRSEMAEGLSTESPRTGAKKTNVRGRKRAATQGNRSKPRRENTTP